MPSQKNQDADNTLQIIADEAKRTAEEANEAFFERLGIVAPLPEMTAIEQAQAHITSLIKDAQCEKFSEKVHANTRTITFTVSHPKRVLKVNSFANAAKKNGLTAYGTKDATNSSQYIVAYVNVDAKTELKVSRDNWGYLIVEVHMKF